MNVLLISQCEKRALTETRRILDQFAERRGERTWQTPITQDGLDTLRRLLRKTARKNTAVACHWIRGLDHSELLWTVGDASRFNAQGAVPTNTTRCNVLRAQEENDWHSGQDIDLLAALAALLHDLGKACVAFQRRLDGKWEGKNDYRHEWVSLRLFEAFVGGDDDATWLARLAGPEAGRLDAWLGADRLRCDQPGSAFQSPFRTMLNAPLAQAVGWLVVTHHRLPVMPTTKDDGSPAPLGWRVKVAAAQDLKDVLLKIQSTWNELPESTDPKRLQRYWAFEHGLPVTTPLWQRQAARIAQRLLKLLQRSDRGADYHWLRQPYVMHLSRLALMLADHHYSSLEGEHAERVKVDAGCRLFANTRKDGKPNQALDEHLIGVAKVSREIAHALPRFDEALPRLLKCRALRQRASQERFRWQDKAADLAAGLRERSRRQGAFIVNMASTGCGKTLANARVMYALADPMKGLRCAFAMGLRTLTLQTGREMRAKLGMGDDELAIRVGGAASRELFEHYEAQAEKTGSASRQDLLEEDSPEVDFEEGREDGHPLLRRVLHDPNARKLLLAPVLVCTIDHLTPATESQRGGRQIAPMLRLLSGDLVLDEPDDFGLEDLPALTRLVHWAGLLGSRVLLSSATLPPSLVLGLFEAYRHGREHFSRHRSDRPSGTDAPPAVCCLWIDEFDRVQADCASREAFAQAHGDFARARYRQLAKLVATEARRRVELVPLDLSGARGEKARYEAFAARVLASAATLHRRHAETDPGSGKRVSFGLVRMANIEPLYEVALALYRLGAPEGLRIHLCVYHSQFPLLVRSAIEHQLDAALKRHDPKAVFERPDVRRRIDGHPEADHLFIVLGTSVTEVGRDHSYRWAVAEPSSLRSLIQLLGRVRRHQPGPCGEPNVHVLSHNLRHFEQPGRAAFCRPGYERDDGEFHLESHDLRQLLAGLDVEHLDARPRIVEAAPLQPQHRLADLEHARTAAEVLPCLEAPAPSGRRARGSAQTPQRRLNAASWWCAPPQDALTTAFLPQQQRFRDDSAEPEVELRLMPDEEGERCALVEMVDERRRGDRERPWLEIDKGHHKRVPDQDVQGPGIAPWGVTDYLEELQRLAQEKEMRLFACALRYGAVTVPRNAQGWRFHPALGFAKAQV